MKIISAKPALTAAVLLAALWGTASFAYTGGHGGGGGHSGGGAHFSGGHAFSGGSHFSGGTHFSGGSHFSGGTHFSGGAQFGGAAHFGTASGATHYSVPAAHAFATARPTVYTGATRTGGAIRPPSAGFHGRPFGPGYGHFGHWGGGYWGGRFWPAAYYGPGFAWFLPTIPLYCSTFWWNSVPYYYYNDIYYTWNPAADGYVATDPPPVATTPPSSDGATASPDGAVAAAPDRSAENSPAPDDAIPPGQFAAGSASAGGSDHVFAYPANGQSEQQQAQDRAACDQWAASQAGASDSADYHRAVIACFQGRGYSAQ